ncbi:MAG: c-type cytochrome [Chloroflexi bacterium]|nr:c-type cytochrome [Chloroflexota bacterium]
MFNYFRRLIKALPLLALTFAGMMAAQNEEPALTCTAAEMAQQQAALAQALAAAANQMADDPYAALDTWFKTGAAAQEAALNCGYVPPDVATRAVGADVPRILNLLDEVSGDPLNGQLLYNSDTLACYGCHVTQAGEAAPALDGTYTRAEETRLHDPALADYTISQYLVESIVHPGQYVSPGYDNVMPNNYGERLSLQDLADLLAYLESQDGESPE